MGRVGWTNSRLMQPRTSHVIRWHFRLRGDSTTFRLLLATIAQESMPCDAGFLYGKITAEVTHSTLHGRVLIVDGTKETTMKAINRQFTEIINGNRQFLIPVFQRDYSWTAEQCLDMWNAILGTSNSSEDGGHFMGSIVYIATDSIGASFQSWLVIDGQQRLTTLTLLLTPTYSRDGAFIG